MPYTPKTWIDYPNTTTPITAAELNNIDVGVRSRFICTSSTRPGSPYDGQKIYETDTDLEFIWDGSSWVSAGAPPMTSYTPTITLNGITSSYTLQTGEYRVNSGICEARFNCILAQTGGFHSVPYAWVGNLPQTTTVTTGYKNSSLSNAPVYPCGWGTAGCAATSSIQNVLFYLVSTTEFHIYGPTHNGNVWSPSPDPIYPDMMVSGVLYFPV